MLMMALSAYFWYVEIKYYIVSFKEPKYSKYAIVRFFQIIRNFCGHMLRLFTDGKYFLLDISITLFAVGFLGFGDGVTGGIMGLTLSNAVSLLIIFVMRSKRKLQKERISVNEIN